MSETTAVIDNPIDQVPARTIFDQKEGVDWFLAWIIDLAERGIELGVTLSVEGLLISGNLIGGRKYFEALGDSIRKANFGAAVEADSEFQTNMANNFAGWKEIYPKSEDIGSDHVPNPSFIHLEHAQIVLGNTPVTSNVGALWRGKLSSVSGFTLGTINFGRS